ncbi:hypothetical protein F2P81_024487 [Scophthalmus maximus]|uniref:Uncharacterized protein n=1 Tax=Scophthalmus maximus TaxID=52904 RepID=A0A6A4RU64_SCOMX|nr:hypothetical protein F2P81_024487 [Scophthalmus maximus]
MSGSREEERRKLADIINHWNANRLDLFEISRPTECGAEFLDWLITEVRKRCMTHDVLEGCFLQQRPD